MLVRKPLVLANSTDKAITGNHPEHGRGRDLQAHLITGHFRGDDQLPGIDGDPQLTLRVCVSRPQEREEAT